MAFYSPDQAQLSSFNKNPDNVSRTNEDPKASTASASAGRKQKSARVGIGGSGIRDNAEVTMCDCVSDLLTCRYFCPAIFSTSGGMTLPEPTSKDLMNYLRVAEEERRLFPSWGENATHLPEAGKYRAQPIADDISRLSEDILYNLRITDEERYFLQELRGNTWSTV